MTEKEKERKKSKYTLPGSKMFLFLSQERDPGWVLRPVYCRPTKAVGSQDKTPFFPFFPLKKKYIHFCKNAQSFKHFQ